jgi:predicted nucleic acid-binding protein
MKSSSPRLHSPALCDLEVASYLRRKLRERAISEDDARDLVVRLLDMPIERADHRPLLGRILQLRDRLSAYDAAYVALAEALAAPLATADAGIANVARELGIAVVT